MFTPAQAIAPTDLSDHKGTVTARIGDRFTRNLDERWEIVGFGLEIVKDADNGVPVANPQVNCRWVGDGPPPSWVSKFLSGPDKNIMGFVGHYVAGALRSARQDSRGPGT